VNPANGFRVQGYLAEQIGNQTIINPASALRDLVIPVGSKDPAQATTEVLFACNLDKRTPLIPPGTPDGDIAIIEGTWSTTFDVFDSFGRAHQLQVSFTRDPAQVNRWRAEAVIDPDAAVGTNTAVGGQAGPDANVFYLNFDNLGALQSVTDAAANVLDAEGGLGLEVGFDVPEANLDPAGAVTRQTFNLQLGTVGDYARSITQFASRSTTKMIQQDGYTLGYLESFRIDQNGVIMGVFSNGTNRAIGQVALASFTNPGGLEKAGENNYVVTINSGAPNVDTPNTAGKGKIIAGALEMSNVDLAEQFTDMIVTQRGFQANSRSITTADQMLQEVLTLKR
jgi:flagellar hook protein FlgE